MKVEHQLLTKIARTNDRPLLEGLRRVGFKLESDPESAGWPTKYFTRGGGYYFNVGGSDLLVSGEVGLVQYEDIETFEADGVRLKGGSRRPFDLVILATGYKGFADMVKQMYPVARMTRSNGSRNYRHRVHGLTRTSPAT